jgi:D-alanyl-lipoteichoic acid acyltransferase DltB (MBOAT superfamily)
MAFSSLAYLLFLPALFLAFTQAPERFRLPLLLAASLAFYAALKAPWLLLALGIVTAVTYAAGLAIGSNPDEGRKRRLLLAGVLADLAVLAFLRYFPASSPLSTIGVSYFVFQAIAYLVDVRMETVPPETRFLPFALYLCFFPKLLQGPIERAADLLPQLSRRYRFDYQAARAGLLLFGWGLFKKVVIADRLGLYVDDVYGDVRAYSGMPLLLATYLYAIQLYCDFSGYTDMALGSARLFGIRLTDNFDSPYLATSIADFWRRWHITLSRWLFDYIFKPLQMGLRDWRAGGTAAALLVTFLASGLWHGAGWTFVAWGMLHGLFLASAVLAGPARKRIEKAHPRIAKSPLRKAWQRFATFHLVCFGWIFFRAKDLSDAIYVAGNIAGGFGGLAGLLGRHGRFDLAVGALSLAAALGVHLASRRPAAGERFFGSPAWIRWTVYLALGASIFLLRIDSARPSFIYFQF